MASTKSSALRWALARVDILQAMAPEHLTLRTGGVENAVAEEEEHISCARVKIQFVIGGIGKQTDG